MDLVGVMLLLPFAVMAVLIAIAAYVQMKQGRASALHAFHERVARSWGVGALFSRWPHEQIWKFSFLLAGALVAGLIGLMIFALVGGNLR